MGMTPPALTCPRVDIRMIVDVMALEEVVVPQHPNVLVGDVGAEQRRGEFAVGLRDR